jgi:hypothetical protein
LAFKAANASMLVVVTAVLLSRDLFAIVSRSVLGSIKYAKGVAMFRVSNTLGFAIAILFQTAAWSEPTKDRAAPLTIPLDKIWAYEMPRTREVRRLGNDADRTFLEPILESGYKRANRLKYKELARPGFAVSGSGLEALKAAHAVFVEGVRPRDKFSPHDEITVVVFSELVGGRVVLQHVERKSKRIEIQYRLEPRILQGGRINLALIPLGKLPIGEYRVDTHQLPLDEKWIKAGLKAVDAEWSRKFLCKPFNFTVAEKYE